MAIPSPLHDPNRDLGLGGRMSQSATRLMNRDGSFNVVRRGLSWRSVVQPYHQLLTMSWTGFLSIVIGCYVGANVVFAFIYLACGPGALSGTDAPTWQGRFAHCFYFSVQTLATIGYGKMTPESAAANLIVAVEALTGLLGFAFATGLLFARFSRPTAHIVFSNVALIAPFQHRTALMLRLANGRLNELSDMRATVTLARREEGIPARRFYRLNLERDQVTFLATQWVIVHPIDENSPLFGLSEDQFHASEPEVLVHLTAIDETFYQSVAVRCSYYKDEIVWGARFLDIYQTRPDGKMYINVQALHRMEPVELPSRQIENSLQ